METLVERGHKVEEHFLFALRELDEALYEKYCQGEISVEELQKTYEELRLWSQQAETLISRLKEKHNCKEMQSRTLRTRRSSSSFALRA